MTDEELAALKAEQEAEAKAKAEEEALETKQKADDEAAKQKLKETSNKPTDAEAKLLKEVMAAKAKLKEAETKAKELESKYSGIDLEAAMNALKALEEQENKELERKGEYDRLIQKQKEAHAKEKAELEAKLKEIADAAQAASKNIEQLTVGSAFANSKFILENLTLTPNKTKALYGDYFEFEEGGVVAYDKPRGSNNRTKIIDGSGEPVSFEEAIKQIIESDDDKDTLLRADLRSGAGSRESKVDKSKLKENKTGLSSLDRIMQGLKEQKLV